MKEEFEVIVDIFLEAIVCLKRILSHHTVCVLPW